MGREDEGGRRGERERERGEVSHLSSLLAVIIAAFGNGCAIWGNERCCLPTFLMIPVPHIFFSLSRKEARLSERRGIWNAMMQLVRSGWSGDGRRWTWTQTHTRRQQITSLLLSCYCPSGPSHAAQQETQKVQRMHVQSPSKRLLLGSVYSPSPGSGITQPRMYLFERTRAKVQTYEDLWMQDQILRE